MLAAVLAVGAFVGMLLMGFAALSFGSGERHWRAHAVADQRGHTAMSRGAPAFEPLKMDPFTLRWPSEVHHEDKRLPELPWPSETWDDEYFGTRSRDDVRKIKQTADALDAKRARTTQQAQRRQAGTAEPGPEPAPEAPKAKKAKKRKKDVQDEAVRRASNVAEAAAQAHHEVSEVAEDFFREAAVEPPTADEIAVFVRSYGLQAAIEHIRARTGWDFPTATQHLAQILRDQKT